MNKIIAGVFATVLVAYAPAVRADTVEIDDEDSTVVERSVDADDDDGFSDRARVYGWVNERPLDCGAYRYWDGEDCVDARSVPPDVGPK